MTATFDKDPSAKLDYTVDWTDWLAGDTISSVSWTVAAGLTQYSVSNTTTVATIWLTSGTSGEEYLVTCEITTAGGRIDQRSIKIKAREK